MVSRGAACFGWAIGVDTLTSSDRAKRSQGVVPGAMPSCGREQTVGFRANLGENRSKSSRDTVKPSHTVPYRKPKLD